MTLLKLSLPLVLLLQSMVLASAEQSLPNYITAEEFAKARLNPLQANNSRVLPLPPYEQNQLVHPRPGFGPRLWTNAQVPYTLDPTFSNEQRDQVAIALNTFHEATCIRFIPKEGHHTSWVDILHDPAVCGVAHVCMNNGGQFAKFGGSCVSPGTMVHELGHTLCMGHEQTRQDRDKWIRFDPNVCEPHGMDGSDFNRGLHKLYDYVSIEHYEGECYNGCFLPTQPGVTKCGSGGPLGVLDIEILNEMYGCNSGCQGYRYVNMNNQLVNPVEAGTDINGETLLSCRAYHQGDILPGKYSPSRKECHVSLNGAEHSKTADVEVLTNPHGTNFQWVRSAGLPGNAVRGGRTNERETLYVIKCFVANQNLWLPGKYQPSTGPYTSFGGGEIRCSDEFLFLACQ